MSSVIILEKGRDVKWHLLKLQYGPYECTHYGNMWEIAIIFAVKHSTFVHPEPIHPPVIMWHFLLIFCRSMPLLLKAGTTIFCYLLEWSSFNIILYAAWIQCVLHPRNDFSLHPTVCYKLLVIWLGYLWLKYSRCYTALSNQRKSMSAKALDIIC